MHRFFKRKTPEKDAEKELSTLEPGSVTLARLHTEVVNMSKRMEEMQVDILGRLSTLEKRVDKLSGDVGVVGSNDVTCAKSTEGGGTSGNAPQTATGVETENQNEVIPHIGTIASGRRWRHHIPDIHLSSTSPFFYSVFMYCFWLHS